MATSGLSYDNRSSPSGFALGNGTVINNNSSVLWINYYLYLLKNYIFYVFHLSEFFTYPNQKNISSPKRFGYTVLVQLIWHTDHVSYCGNSCFCSTLNPWNDYSGKESHNLFKITPDPLQTRRPQRTTRANSPNGLDTNERGKLSGNGFLLNLSTSY